MIGFNESAGVQRAPSYSSLELHMEKDGTLFGRPFGFFVQIRNTFNRDNLSSYAGSVRECGEVWNVDCTLTDYFEDGIPLLPLFGFWMRL